MNSRHIETSGPQEDSASTRASASPGKVSRTERLPVQRKATATGSDARRSASVPSDNAFNLHLVGQVQRHGDGAVAAGDVHAAASRGIAAPTTAMPHASAIQASFGDAHDISGISAHVGGAAADACGDMSAQAFAVGNHVAFAGQPDLHTAAHEAAHVVQQAQGVNLYDGVGEAGDVYERHADAVADRVVAGQSATELLTHGPLGAPPGGAWGNGLQRKIAVPVVQQKPRTAEGAAAEGAAAEGAAGEAGAAAAPAGNGKVARLRLFVDIDVKHLGLKDLKEGNVGHTWISLEYIEPATVPATVHANHLALLQTAGKYADPMGFWPDTQNGVYYSTNPLNSYVDGWMRHPDRAHQGAEKAVQTWELTQAEVDAVIAYAESKRGAKYSVYFFNCTTFGKEAVQAAGKSAPSMSTAGICMPNSAYDGIMKRQKANQGDTWTQDIETGAETTAHGEDGKKA